MDGKKIRAGGARFAEIERDHYRRAFNEQVRQNQRLERELQECRYELERDRMRRQARRRDG